MKYIKKYEMKMEMPITTGPKFRKGDWVSVVSFFNNEKIYKSKPYEIVDLNYNIGNYPVKACWEYCLDDKDSGKFWRKEANLELVPDYELDAMKYNL